MQTASKIIYVFNGILLFLSTCFQVLAMIGCLFVPDATLAGKLPWLSTGWFAALGLLLVSYVLCGLLKEKGKLPLIPLVLALLGAFLALLVALTLKNEFPALVGVSGTQGLTVWRLCYRHLSSVLVGLLTALCAYLNIRENREQRIREENAAYRSIYDLSGDPLFKDNSTIGLDTFANEDESAPAPKRKRSLRQAEKKRREAAVKAAERAEK